MVTTRWVGDRDRLGAMMGEGRPLSVRGVPTAGQARAWKHGWAGREGKLAMHHKARPARTARRAAAALRKRPLTLAGGAGGHDKGAKGAGVEDDVRLLLHSQVQQPGGHV